MDQGRTIKKIFGSKLEGSRRKGRPRLRWLEGAEKGLWEVKVKRWGQKAAAREDWATLIMEARVRRRPQSQGVSK
jgi:hypothetical protein